MDKKIILEIKKKKEFSQLPDSIVDKVSKITNGDIKEARALLRKYFGIFLTNRILRGKVDLLKTHISSKKRDYDKFYGEIFDCVGKVSSVVDLGCGVNGFSYKFLSKGVSYFGVEAAGQVVFHMNKYFEKNGFYAKAIVGDLFEIDKIIKILSGQKKSRVVFLFQVVDALENLERDFSKKFILDISKECEWIVLTLPTEIFGGRKKFIVRRKWIIDFLEDNFKIKKDFELNGERCVVFHK